MPKNSQNHPERPTNKGKSYGPQLDPKQRRFVLRLFGEYKTGIAVAEALKERWGIDRNPEHLEAHYRYNPQYKAQLQVYRDRYLANEREHPLNQKPVLLDYIQKGMDIAIGQKDVKGLAALVRQVADMNGYNAPEQIEVTASSTGKSFEDLLSSLLDAGKGNAQAIPTAGALPGEIPASLQTIDAITAPE